MVVQHQLSIRQTGFRINCESVHEVGEFRRLDFLHDEIEETGFVG
jgi:hypothetical protein